MNRPSLSHLAARLLLPLACIRKLALANEAEPTEQALSLANHDITLANADTLFIPFSEV